jgi:carbon-monoxide dehydrogenase medium subunit
MKNPPFEYRRPASIEEALTVLVEHPGAKIIAGGQSLLPLMALRLATPPLLVDIGGLPGLDAIEQDDDGGVRIGALVSHAAAERSEVLANEAPLVHEAMPLIGHRAIRNRGTVCGSVAHGDPAAEMPAVLLALEGAVVARSVRGTREIAARDFFAGYLDTSLEEDEIVTAVRVPPWGLDATGAIVEVARRHGDYALVGLVAVLEVRDGTIERAALSFFGVAGTPTRVTDAEAALRDHPPSEELFETAGEIVAATVDPTADLHASANHRRHLAAVLTRRGLRTAIDRIGAPA